LSSVAFSPDEFKEAAKQFRGVIVKAEYGENPFGFEGRPDIPRMPQLAIAIETPDYDKLQYEWYRPTNVRKTKWSYFIDALTKTGAMKDIVIKGSSDEERLKSFAESLVGMEFDWTQYTDLEIIVKGRTIELLLPDKYYGKKEVKPIEEIREEKVEL